MKTTFQINSMYNTTKNVSKKHFGPVGELNLLIKKDDGRHNEQAEPFNKQNGRGREKNGRRPRFLS